ncbi:MAG: NPCBM/NEW2 domain-containing protein [Gemmataceae bacterium]|nr:NPCBM/NEW2 domain-containing protein [Gemmataceae bacterium]
MDSTTPHTSCHLEGYNIRQRGSNDLLSRGVTRVMSVTASLSLLSRRPRRSSPVHQQASATTDGFAETEAIAAPPTQPASLRRHVLKRLSLVLGLFCLVMELDYRFWSAGSLLVGSGVSLAAASQGGQFVSPSGPNESINDEWIVYACGSELPKRGTVVALDKETTRLRLANGQMVSLTGVYHWQRSEVPFPRFPTAPHFLTVAGDRITGTFRGLDQDRLVWLAAVHSQEAPPWRVPWSALQVVWLIDQPAHVPLHPSEYPWLRNIVNHDVLLLRNGDVLRGVLLENTGADPSDRCTIQLPAGTTRQLTPQQVAAIAFNPALLRMKKVQEPLLLVVLQDGSRLHLRQFRLADQTLHGTTLWGAAVVIPWPQVVGASLLTSAIPRLTDLSAVQVEQQPYLDTVTPLGRHCQPDGRPLELFWSSGKATADWGLALTPRTSLRYQLAGRYRRLEAWVALAPSAAPTSRVRLRLVGDDRSLPLPHDGLLTYGPAQWIQVPLHNAQELTLTVDFASAGEPGAVTLWGWPRLIP